MEINRMPKSDTQFKPGNRGRPPGTLTRKTADELLTAGVDAILERVIEQAIGGDMTAAAVALDHYRSRKEQSK
jgi:hypothetical protein